MKAGIFAFESAKTLQFDFLSARNIKIFITFLKNCPSKSHTYTVYKSNIFILQFITNLKIVKTKICIRNNR